MMEKEMWGRWQRVG